VEATRPLLFVDIDGVLNPYGGPCPAGFAEHDLFPADNEPVRVNAAHAHWLCELADVFDLVWGTGWNDTDRAELSTVLDLPAFAGAAVMPDGEFDPKLKVPAIDAVAGDRALAWIDDRLTPEASEWAATRAAPTLLVPVASDVGLTRAHVDALLGWATGTEIVRRMAHGEGSGAYEVRFRGAPAVLKVGNPDPVEMIDAPRARGYPAAAILKYGAGYQIAELLPGAPLETVSSAHVSLVVALVDLQRDIGLPPERPWIDDIVTSVTEGRVGYCELGALGVHDPARLTRLQRIADRARDLDVPTSDAVHFDFSPLNILAAGGHIAGVIDWQGATVGDAAFDLVTLAFYTYDAAARDTLLDAARAVTDPRVLELYAAHMTLRQLDWSLRHHDAVAVEWFTAISDALFGAL
jgi:hypothetical protein